MSFLERGERVAALPDWLGDVRVPDDLRAVYEANELLQSLASVSNEPIAPLMRALVAAVGVLGDDMVRRALVLMAARPNGPPKRERMITRMEREACQGTAVAPTKRLYQLYHEMGSPRLWQWDVDPTKVDYSRPAVEIARELAETHLGEPPTPEGYLARALARASATGGPVNPAPVTHACEFCNTPDDGSLKRQDMGEGRSMLLCGLCRGTIALGQWKETHAPPDAAFSVDLYDLAPEPEVDEAVTPDVAALMADGDVAGAQKAILDGLASYHKDEAVMVPPNAPVYPAPVMPAPRAGSIPIRLSYSTDMETPIQPTPTGKPCRACMRPAFFVVECEGKTRHYCADHFDATGKA